MAGWIALVGGNEFRPECEPMDRALLALLGGELKTVIIPAAAARENPSLAAANGVRHFRGLGADSAAVMIIDDESARDPSLISQIRAADLVYFTGGDPAYLLQTMRGSPAWQTVLSVFQGGRMVAGSSAGAMILGGRMWVPGEGWREGLGLLPQAAVIPHHARLAARWDAGHMRALLEADVFLLGIDEATALVWPPGQVIGAGEVVLYAGRKKTGFAHGQSVPLPP